MTTSSPDLGSPTRPPTIPTIGQRLDDHQPVVLPDAYRPQHVCVIGRTGYGKTTLLEHLIVEDLRTRTSAIMIDPHGDLSHRIISLASSEERQRITLLEVWSESPFRLNLLECADPTQLDRTVDDLLTLFHRLFDPQDSAIGLRLHRYLGNALRTLTPNKRPLTDVQRLFIDPAFRNAMLANVTNRKVHGFWLLYDQMPPRERIEQLESTINRLDEFLSTEAAYAMVDTTTTTIPLDNVLDTDGQLLLLRIPVGELGELQARFYGSLFLSLLTDRLFARASVDPAERHRLHLYLDEYGWFATSTTAALLQQARKYNLGATLAFQTLSDLPDEKNRAAILQAGTHILLRLTGPNADELVSNFPVIPRKQREETIWETVGTQATEGPTQEPVAWLRTHSHQWQIATQAAQSFLIPLARAAEDKAESERRLGTRSSLSPEPLSAQLLTNVLRQINQLLVLAMEQGTALQPEPTAEIMADIFISLEAYYKLPYHWNNPDRKLPWDRVAYASDPAFKATLVAHFAHWVRAFFSGDTSSADDYMRNCPEDELPWAILIARNREHLSQEAQREATGVTYSERGRKAIELHRKLTVTGEEIKANWKRLWSDANDLLVLCHALANKPITVPTGQHEPQLRPYHITYPAQTQADARLELAGTLATLPRFTAYYQTPDSHGDQPESYGQLYLSEPEQDGYIDQAAIEEVTQRSKDLYSLPIEPPDDTPPDPSSSPPPGSQAPSRPPGDRITRRSPRTAPKEQP